MVVKFKPGQPMILRYDIVDTYQSTRGLRGELFRPLIQNDYLYVHGINLFLEPHFRSQSGRITQEVTWVSKPPFRIFQSYDPDNPGSTTSTGDPESFRMTLITGSTDLIVERSDAHGIRNYLVLRKHKDPEFNPSVNQFFTRFNSSSRAFWKDYSDTYYSLILQPYQHATRRISGIAMLNGFLGKFHGDSTLKQDQIQVLGHEMSHHWTGVKITMSTAHQWFDEGFTDYITLFTLVSSGLMSPQQFETEINRIIKSLYTSEARLTPNDKVFENYWKMGDHNKLPYWRGSLFAFYLDNQIALQSKGKKSIRDLMLQIFQFVNQQPPGYSITMDDFIRIASSLVSQTSLKQALDRYILEGTPIPFNTSMLQSFYQVDQEGGLPRIIISNQKKFKSHFNFK